METVSKQYKIDIGSYSKISRPQLILELQPCTLWALFGYPLLNDGYWDSFGTYVFVSSSGDVITINHLASSVWPLLFRLLKKRFWRSRKTERLVVGAERKELAENFSQWLSETVHCKISNWPE